MRAPSFKVHELILEDGRHVKHHAGSFLLQGESKKILPSRTSQYGGIGQEARGWLSWWPMTSGTCSCSSSERKPHLRHNAPQSRPTHQAQEEGHFGHYPFSLPWDGRQNLTLPSPHRSRDASTAQQNRKPAPVRGRQCQILCSAFSEDVKVLPAQAAGTDPASRTAESARTRSFSSKLVISLAYQSVGSGVWLQRSSLKHSCEKLAYSSFVKSWDWHTREALGVWFPGSQAWPGQSLATGLGSARLRKPQILLQTNKMVEELQRVIPGWPLSRCTRQNHAQVCTWHGHGGARDQRPLLL
jgi:hypothetical protein